MPKNFWLLFAVNEAASVAAAFVSVSTLTATQQKALNDLIAAATEVTTAFSS